MPLTSRDVAIDPFSLSATAAEPLTGIASAPLSYLPTKQVCAACPTDLMCDSMFVSVHEDRAWRAKLG